MLEEMKENDRRLEAAHLAGQTGLHLASARMHLSGPLVSFMDDPVTAPAGPVAAPAGQPAGVAAHQPRHRPARFHDATRRRSHGRALRQIQVAGARPLSCLSMPLRRPLRPHHEHVTIRATLR